MSLVRCDKKSRAFSLHYKKEIFPAAKISLFYVFCSPKNFLPFRLVLCSTVKNESQRQKLLLKICISPPAEIDLLQFRLFYFPFFSVLLNLYAIISCFFVDFRVSLFVLSRILSFLRAVFLLPKRQKKLFSEVNSK